MCARKTKHTHTHREREREREREKVREIKRGTEKRNRDRREAAEVDNELYLQ